MKLFISWSGERSQALAQALHEWLPLVLHYVEPWLSEADVSAGERWAQAVAKELEASNFGIICVTPENVGSPWVLFEAGALAKSMQGAKVIPLLLNLEFSDITGPLAQFQAKKVERSGLGEVVQSINHATDHAIPDDRVRQLFVALWPELEKRMAEIPKEVPTEKHMRPHHEILEELVTSVRGFDSRFRDLEGRVDQRPYTSDLDPRQVDATKPEEVKSAILAQFHAAEYAVFMGRVSSWESLQYAAWPILIAALAFLFQIENIPLNYRWWAALISFQLVYVAYQGTMVNMLYSVLFIEQDLRPLAGELIGAQNFWIYERIRERNFPSNPAWSLEWPIVMSFLAIGLVTGGLAYEYGFHWQDVACFVIAVLLGVLVVILTQSAKRMKRNISKACYPDVKPVKRTAIV